MRRRDGGRYSAGVGLDVSPVRSPDNASNSGRATAVFCSERPVTNPRPVFGANGEHLIFLQSRCPATLALMGNGAPTSFGIHIPHIVEMGARKNVCRIAAFRIVAGMAPFKPLGERLSLGVGIRNLVSVIMGALVSQRAVAEPRSRSLPLPTFIRPALVDLVPDRAGERAMRLPRVRIWKWLFAAATDKVSALFAHGYDDSGQRASRQRLRYGHA